MSMANSLELRTPFLDFRLVEWAAKLPARLKVGRGADGHYRTKEILRRYARSRLPPTVIERQKQGFPVPVYEWLAAPLAGWARDMLGEGARLKAWFDPKALTTVAEKGTTAGAAMIDRHRLWNLLILEIWAQRWLA
jgi:asparagine synthase (glutamine-hydrolysing)